MERHVLDQLRRVLRLPHHLTWDLMPQSGYTETVSADAISVPQLWQLALDAIDSDAARSGAR